MGWKSGVWAAACAATIAAIVLLGALFDVDGLQRFGGTQPMLPITAVAILVAAAGLVWKRELGVLLVLGGAVSLAYGLSGSEGAAVNTAVCVILLGAGLLCLDRRPGLADAAAVLVARDRRPRAARVPVRRPRAAARAAPVAADADGGADRARAARAELRAAVGALAGRARRR